MMGQIICFPPLGAAALPHIRLPLPPNPEISVGTWDNVHTVWIIGRPSVVGFCISANLYRAIEAYDDHAEALSVAAALADAYGLPLAADSQEGTHG